VARERGGTVNTMGTRHKLNRLALAVLVGMSACSTLPTFEPEAVLAAAPKPQLDGAHGPLSPEQSKAVLAKLAARAPETAIFDRHLAIEEAIVGSPLTVGNQATLLQDGPATYSAMLAAIEAARDHIHLETYILDDDEVGRKFADALIAKQKKGVQVSVIHDSVGTLNTPKDFFKRMTDTGIQVLEFNPVNPTQARKGWELNQRDHRKLLIVDGKVAFLGGINISSVYSSGSFSRSGKGSSGSGSNVAPGKDGKAWRDTHVRLQGPVVAEYQRLFLGTWKKQKGPPLRDRNYFPPLQNVGNQVVRAIGSSPDDPYALIYATLLSAIGAAETSVHITMAYFAPDPQFLEALKAAARRGVDVTLILPSQTDSWLIFHAGREDLRTQGRDPAREDGGDRRGVGHHRLDQPRLAQLPAQRRAERRGPWGRVQPADGGDVLEGPRSLAARDAQAVEEATPGRPDEGDFLRDLAVLALTTRFSAACRSGAGARWDRGLSGCGAWAASLSPGWPPCRHPRRRWPACARTQTPRRPTSRRPAARGPSPVPRGAAPDRPAARASKGRARA
jgi:cardiolipin synthase